VRRDQLADTTSARCDLHDLTQRSDVGEPLGQAANLLYGSGRRVSGVRLVGQRCEATVVGHGVGLIERDLFQEKVTGVVVIWTGSTSKASTTPNASSTGLAIEARSTTSKTQPHSNPCPRKRDNSSSPADHRRSVLGLSRMPGG
jgi:hypothetical protein